MPLVKGDCSLPSHLSGAFRAEQNTQHPTPPHRKCPSYSLRTASIFDAAAAGRRGQETAEPRLRRLHTCCARIPQTLGSRLREICASRESCDFLLAAQLL